MPMFAWFVFDTIKCWTPFCRLFSPFFFTIPFITGQWQCFYPFLNNFSSRWLKSVFSHLKWFAWVQMVTLSYQKKGAKKSDKYKWNWVRNQKEEKKMERKVKICCFVGSNTRLRIFLIQRQRQRELKKKKTFSARQKQIIKWVTQ